MKVIPRNVATAATATSAAAGWPATNVLEGRIKKAWKAASSSVLSATLTVESSGQQDSLAVLGIVADTITVTVSDPNATTWETGTTWEDGTDWAAITPTSVQTYMITDLTDSGADTIGGQKGMAWFEFDEFVSEVQIAITLANTTGRPMTLSIGTVFVGKRVDYTPPKYGLTVNLVDYSVERELANGATFYKARDLVREFGLTIPIKTQDEFDVLWQMYRRYRRIPMPMLLVEGLGSQWLIMGRLQAMQGGIESYRYSPVSMTVREEI